MVGSRRDPRAEEDSEVPPPSNDQGFAVDHVGAVPAPRAPVVEPPKPAPKTPSLPPAAQETPASTPRFDARADPPSLRPAVPSSVPPPPEAPRRPSTPAPASPRASRVEPRLIPLDRMIHDNDWRAVAQELGPPSEAGKLAPNLALLAAIAHRETSEEGTQEATAVGVEAMASLLGVPPDGAIAGVVARRLLRTNPVRFRDRKAPPARVSVLIVIVTLVLGGTVGWLLSGGWNVVRHLLR